MNIESEFVTMNNINVQNENEQVELDNLLHCNYSVGNAGSHIANVGTELRGIDDLMVCGSSPFGPKNLDYNSLLSDDINRFHIDKDLGGNLEFPAEKFDSKEKGFVENIQGINKGESNIRRACQYENKSALESNDTQADCVNEEQESTNANKAFKMNCLQFSDDNFTSDESTFKNFEKNDLLKAIEEPFMCSDKSFQFLSKDYDEKINNYLSETLDHDMNKLECVKNSSDNESTNIVEQTRLLNNDSHLSKCIDEFEKHNNVSVHDIAEKVLIDSKKENHVSVSSEANVDSISNHIMNEFPIPCIDSHSLKNILNHDDDESEPLLKEGSLSYELENGKYKELNNSSDCISSMNFNRKRKREDSDMEDTGGTDSKKREIISSNEVGDEVAEREEKMDAEEHRESRLKSKIELEERNGKENDLEIEKSNKGIEEERNGIESGMQESSNNIEDRNENIDEMETNKEEEMVRKETKEIETKINEERNGKESDKENDLEIEKSNRENGAESDMEERNEESELNENNDEMEQSKEEEMGTNQTMGIETKINEEKEEKQKENNEVGNRELDDTNTIKKGEMNNRMEVAKLEVNVMEKMDKTEEIKKELLEKEIKMEETEDLIDSVKALENVEKDSPNDLIIGEAFTINEEQMKELENFSDNETATESTETFTKPEESVRREKKAFPVKIRLKLSNKSRKKYSKKNARRQKRSLFFTSIKKKKKASYLVDVPLPMPSKHELTLPAFLQELAGIDPSLIVVRERSDEEGKKVRVSCITFHEAVLDWAFSETLLSSTENSKRLRSRFRLKGRSNLVFPDVDRLNNDTHPVMLGQIFPFSMPQIREEKNEDQDTLKLSFPLEQLCLLCPAAKGFRDADGEKPTRLETVSFADEPLEWAFRETFLSSFEDSPILSDLLGLNATTKKWPDVAEEILAHEEVNYTFPFASPNSKKHFDGLLFSDLSPQLPSSLLHETLQLPVIPQELEKSLFGERNSMVRLLAVASFYKHSSCIPTVRTNRKLSAAHSALVASFRPLIISQANKLGMIIKDTRAFLLQGVTCQDTSIIPALIRGPIHSKRGIIFSNVQKLETAVAKDPNNKLQYI